MREIISFIVVIFLYVLILFVFLIRKKVVLKRTKKEQSIEDIEEIKELKQQIKLIKILLPIVFIIFLLGISYNYYLFIKTETILFPREISWSDVIRFVKYVMWSLLVVYIIVLDAVVVTIPYIKEMEKK